MTNLWKDLRYAVRQLRKSPGFTLTAILTLALGIAAITTVSAILKAVALEPWPHVTNVRAIRLLSASQPQLGNDGYSLHYSEYVYLRQHAHTMCNFTAYELIGTNWTQTSAAPRVVWTGIVSSNYFAFLGIKPELGRFFNPAIADRSYGAQPEIVLGDAFWRSQFQANPGIIGQTIALDHHPMTIIGVAPPDFVGLYGGLTSQIWAPLSSLPQLDATSGNDPLLKGGYGLQVATRLAHGVGAPQAAAELHALAHQFAAQKTGAFYQDWDLNMHTPADSPRGVTSDINGMLPVLFGASILLLVLVCVNVGGLMAQRGLQRHPALVLQTALGAPRGRLLRQLLFETTLLAVCGGVLGAITGLWLSRVLIAYAENIGMPVAINLHPDAIVFAIVIGVTAFAVLVSSVLPAWQMRKFSVAEVLHQSSISIVGVRVGIQRAVFLSLQLGICFIVLLCTGLLLRTLWFVQNKSIGFQPTNVMVARMDLSRAGYTPEKQHALEQALLDKLRTLPGVTTASLTTFVPLEGIGGGNEREVNIVGYRPPHGDNVDVVTDELGPQYFHVMRIPIIEGRDLTTGDNQTGRPVAIVNQTMAHTYWPNGHALGGVVRSGNTTYQVIGIVRDFVYRNAAYDEAQPLLFLPVLQSNASLLNLVIRTQPGATLSALQLRQAVASIDASIPLDNIATLQQVVADSYSSQRIPAMLLGVYALCGLLISGLAIYAAMAFRVLERSREFALRMALGSDRSGIVRLVLRRALSTVVGGLIFGAVGGFFAVRLLRSLLFGVAPSDVASVLAATIVVTGTALVAAWVPARRAASVDPMTILRAE